MMEQTYAEHNTVCCVQHGNLRLEYRTGSECIEEHWLVQRDTRWVPILSTNCAVESDAGSVPIQCAEVVENSGERAIVRVSGDSFGMKVVLEVTLQTEAPVVHQSVRCVTELPSTLCRLQRRYHLLLEDLEYSFAPYLRPLPTQVLGQHSFRSPALIAQSGPFLVALVPDLDKYPDAARSFPCALHANFQSPVKEIGFGFHNHEPRGFLYFEESEAHALAAGSELSFGFDLLLRSDAPRPAGFRAVTRFLWRRYGHVRFASMLEQQALATKAARNMHEYIDSELWLSLGTQAAGEAGCVPMGVKFPNDVWFGYLFNHLYTAFGFYRLGEQLGDPRLIEKARRIKNLALSSPRKEGFFPAIYSSDVVTGKRCHSWIPSSAWLPGRIAYHSAVERPEPSPRFHLPDCSWTAYWMLQWYRRLEQTDDRLLHFAREYAETLLAYQLPSGAFPNFVDAETLAILPELLENASSGCSGLFLAELAAVTGEARYKEAACRVAEFLRRAVLPTNRWQDYEYSSDSLMKSRELYDAYTKQYPQTTMPILWGAELFRTLSTIHDGAEALEYLETGATIVDYLCLFQQIWRPPFLSLAVFGGFPVGNGHPAWSDGRQGWFAPCLLQYYLSTGNQEYLERAVAVMRAGLAICFMPENRDISPVWNAGPVGHADENYAPRGRDDASVLASIDLGIGYTMTAAAILRDHCGDLHVNVPRQFACGIDGLSVQTAYFTPQEIRLQISGIALEEREIRVHGISAPDSAPPRITVNGREVVVDEHDWARGSFFFLLSPAEGLSTPIER